MDNNRKLDVELLYMPFADICLPSLSLSLFKAGLTAAGITSRVDYANMRLAKELGGIFVYNQLFDSARSIMLGEYVFKRAAFGGELDDLEECATWVADYVRSEIHDEEEAQRQQAVFPATMLQFARKADEFIEETVERVLATGAEIVAMCSMFQQNNAVIAVARRLKERRPELVILLGGANLHDSAGSAFLEYFPFVDYVFLGEADEIFVPFCQRLLQGERPTGKELPFGIIDRASGRVENVHRLTADLNALPYPDYSDFVKAHEEIFYNSVPHSLFIEGSRGCWWGEKHQCKFCGLNGSTIHYRSKASTRLAEELCFMDGHYPHIFRYMFSDCILSNGHVKELPEALKILPHKVRLFSEVKTTASYEELKALRDVGFDAYQPGIESLNDHMLQLMNKGCRAIKQIETLKSYARLNIWCTWNVLCGFPGETDEDILDMARLVPWLTHLRPPSSFVHIFYQRNSVYEAHREEYGLRMQPGRVYKYICPMPEDFVRRTCYFFEPVDAEQREWYYDCLKKGPAYERLYEALHGWQQSYAKKKDRLLLTDKGDRLEIMDMRAAARSLFYTLTGLKAEIYRKAERVISRKRLAEELPDYSAEEIGTAIAELEEQYLLLTRGDESLALAVKEE